MEVDVRIIYYGDPVPFRTSTEHTHPLSVVPCIVINRSSILSEPGIGMKIFNSEERFLFFSAKGYDYSPLQVWRALSYLNTLLTHNDELSFTPNEHVLAACWHTASNEILHTHQWGPKKLESILGSEKFSSVRTAMESQLPSSDILDNIIMALQNERTAVDFSEIEKEILAGRLTKTALLTTILYTLEEERETSKKVLFDHRSIPREERLGEFFRWLDIRNFTTEARIAMHRGATYAYIGTHEIDVMTTEASYEHYRSGRWKNEFKLFIPTQHEKGIAHPSFKALDGSVYYFKSAIFKEGTFFIKTEIKKIDGSCTEEKYTIKELRASIGELPKKKKRLIDQFIDVIRRLGGTQAS